jgi:hypothetical protein
LLDRERDRRIVEPDRQVNFISVKPLPCDCRADIGFALMVGSYNIDWVAQHFAADIFDCHARRNNVAGTAKVGVVGPVDIG